MHQQQQQQQLAYRTKDHLVHLVLTHSSWLLLPSCADKLVPLSGSAEQATHLGSALHQLIQHQQHLQQQQQQQESKSSERIRLRIDMEEVQVNGSFRSVAKACQGWKIMFSALVSTKGKVKKKEIEKKTNKC